MKRVFLTMLFGVSMSLASDINSTDLQNALQMSNDQKMIPFYVQVEEFACTEKSPKEQVCTAILFLENDYESKRVSVATIPLSKKENGIWYLEEIKK